MNPLSTATYEDVGLSFMGHYAPTLSDQEIPPCKTLKGVSPTPVLFDPENREHQDAYTSLVLTGRQHSTLRFIVEYPFTNAVSMMERKLALYALRMCVN